MGQIDLLGVQSKGWIDLLWVPSMSQIDLGGVQSKGQIDLLGSHPGIK